MLTLVAYIKLRDSGPPHLNLDLMRLPSVANFLRTEYIFCLKILPFIVQAFAKVRIICSENG
jgi:hypothetical protein